MENLNYNHLYYFWTIAKEGGVTAACKKLRLAQPTLSAQLKQFEEMLGYTLFERKSRKLILNDTGKLVFDYADSIFKKGQQMVNALRDRSVKDIVTVNVGVVATVSKKNVHNFLKIPIVYTKVNVNLVMGTLAGLLKKLSSLELDFVISDRAPPADAKNLRSHVLERAPVIFVASPDYKTLRRKFPASLTGQNMFLPSAELPERVKIDQFLRESDAQPRLKGEIEDSELLRVIAVAGHGVVAIARSAVSDLLKAKELYIIGDNLGITKEFYLIVPERKEIHPIAGELIKKFKE